MNTIRILVLIGGVLVCIMGAMLAGCSDGDDNATGPQAGWIWQPLGDGIVGSVSALQEFNGKLYVGGNFYEAGGEDANYIAAWDGTSWSTLGAGTSYPVYCMTIYDGKLIVGGSFGSAGGMQVNRIAAFDGASWSALGSGLEGDYVVLDMCVVRDTLFAVGSEGIGGNAKILIAAWDGSTWAMIESGVRGQVVSACNYNSSLLVGGIYIDEYYMEDPFVKIISGGEWYDWDPSSLPGALHDLTVYDSSVYMGGSSVVPVKRFSVSWQNVGDDLFANSGSTPHVYSLCEFEGNLVVGGRFATIGDETMNRIASWNGTAWSPLGEGIGEDGGVTCMAVWNDRLYVAGSFDEAGGAAVNNIVEVSFE